MSSTADRLEAIAEVARNWRDPDHSPRAAAVEETRAAPNRWTEEALAYTLNRWMQQLTLDALKAWLPRIEGDVGTVGVLHGSGSPLEGLRDALAVWASGYDYVGSLPDASPALLPAFAEELRQMTSGLRPQFVSDEQLYRQVDALIASPSEQEGEAVRERAANHGIPAPRCLVHLPQDSVAVLDGNESDDERERLAEDLLLYEGTGTRRLSVVWAPRDLPPDPYLEAMAHFRGVFPAHPDTPGALQMQKAFLEAEDASHAFAEGLEFLVSRGAPQPQPHGHIRWSEYDEVADVVDWADEHSLSLCAVVARAGLHDQLPVEVSLRTPGGLHVPSLDDPLGIAVVSFLESLAEAE